MLRQRQDAHMLHPVCSASMSSIHIDSHDEANAEWWWIFWANRRRSDWEGHTLLLGVESFCASRLQEPAPPATRAPCPFIAEHASDLNAGVRAKGQIPVNPLNTVFSAKRFIGRKFDEVQDIMTHVPYKVNC